MPMTDDDEPRYQLCERCAAAEEPFEPTPDHPDWVAHKATDESWQEWRDEQRKMTE